MYDNSESMYINIRPQDQILGSSLTILASALSYLHVKTDQIHYNILKIDQKSASLRSANSRSQLFERLARLPRPWNVICAYIMTSLGNDDVKNGKD